MKIESLRVRNLKAIRSIDLLDLGDVVVIAGPNGCGKSQVFDAIRLLKSAYGGYQGDEVKKWFGEFQIGANTREHLSTIFQTKSKPVEIEAQIVLSPEQKEYLSQNSTALIEDYIWGTIDAGFLPGIPQGMPSEKKAVHLKQEEAEAALKKWKPEMARELEADKIVAKVTINPGERLRIEPSILLSLVFSIYDPKRVGIIDYHGAFRNYSREQVGGINIAGENTANLAQHALYDYSQKYSNLKAEMATGYIRQLIAEKAGAPPEETRVLGETLKEMFMAFFPGKEFLGPIPNREGKLEFNVKTQSGATHDINDLSSGEKEVLYGYLRIINSSTRNSILLIDEPELHLNPRLVQGLAGFYYRHLGMKLSNQIWLVTHSDALIRDAVGHGNFRVFHMQPPGTDPDANQISVIEERDDLEKAIISLVGDLATYKPNSKIVIFEGEGDPAFDVNFACTLFPRLRDETTAIPGGNKGKVVQLQELLVRLKAAALFTGKCYSITDNDNEKPIRSEKDGYFIWDVYHIENYLLHPRYIILALKEVLQGKCLIENEADVDRALLECARGTMEFHVKLQLYNCVYGKIQDAVRIRRPSAHEPADVSISSKVEVMPEKFRSLVDGYLRRENIENLEKEISRNLAVQLADGSWKKTFRGREILSQFVCRFGGGISYEYIRNLIVARMRDDEYQPAGMKSVIDKILG